MRCWFDSWVGTVPWKKKWRSMRASCLRNPMTGEPGSYSPRGHKRVERDLVTKQRQPSIIVAATELNCCVITRGGPVSHIHSLCAFLALWKGVYISSVFVNNPKSCNVSVKLYRSWKGNWNKFENEYKINVINTILKIACSSAISSTSHMSSCLKLTATTRGRHHYYHPV